MKVTRSGVLALGSALSMAGVGAPAEAATFTVSQTVSPGAALVQGGSSLSGLFDISSLLPGGSWAGASVASATLTAYAFSDRAHQLTSSATPYQVTATTQVVTGWAIGGYYAYSCSFWGSCSYAPYYVPVYGTHTTYERQVTQRDDDLVVDTLSVALTGQRIVAQLANPARQTETAFGNAIYEGGSATSAYYRRENTASIVNDGAINLFGALGDPALADLGADGRLAFAAEQTLGDSTLNWLRLDAVVTVADAAASVPEPGTLGVLALGVAALGATGRRRARDRRGRG